MREEHVSLETPEMVELHLELAGVGSRFLAAFVDSFLQAAAIVAVGAAMGYSRWIFTGDPTRIGMNIAIALGGSMLIIILYYVVFEMIWGGQSPGKRLAGLVVVRDDGGPIGLTESAVRNILRIVDILPLYYTLGMIFIFLTRNCKRVGDLAAGTLVIKAGSGERVPPGPAPQTGAEQEPEVGALPQADPLVLRAMAHIAALTPREMDTVTRFVERRMELEPTGRAAVARRIAEGLRDKFPALSQRDLPDAETFLVIIHRAREAARQGPQA